MQITLSSFFSLPTHRFCQFLLVIWETMAGRKKAAILMQHLTEYHHSYWSCLLDHGLNYARRKYLWSHALEVFDRKCFCERNSSQDVPTHTDASPEISHEEYNARLIEYEQEVSSALINSRKTSTGAENKLFCCSFKVRKLLSEHGIPEEAIEEYFVSISSFDVMRSHNERNILFWIRVIWAAVSLFHLRDRPRESRVKWRVGFSYCAF